MKLEEEKVFVENSSIFGNEGTVLLFKKTKFLPQNIERIKFSSEKLLLVTQ